MTLRTYAELEGHVADCGEWATVHQLEAIAEDELDRLLSRFGDDVTDAPEPLSSRTASILASPLPEAEKTRRLRELEQDMRKPR